MEKGSSDMGAGDLYSAIIEKIFFDHYQDGDTDVKFRRSEILDAAIALGVPRPKNAGDVIYAFKFRRLLPESIRTLAPEGKEWIIRNAGRGLYAFGLITTQNIAPSELLIQTKIPDATPGVIKKYALNDEQSLLATLRYNRLIDLFLGLTCYSSSASKYIDRLAAIRAIIQAARSCQPGNY